MPKIPIPANGTEIIDRRTSRSKSFSLPGNKTRCVVSPHRVHYQDGNSWQEIDTGFSMSRGILKIENAPYILEILKTGIGYKYSTRQGGSSTVTLSAIDGVPYVGAGSPTVSKDSVWWEDVATDIDIGIRAGEVRIQSFRRLKSAQAPRSFTWTITHDGKRGSTYKINTKPVGRDNENEKTREGTRRNKSRELEIQSVLGPVVTVGKISTFTITETWTGKTKYRDPTTRIPKWKSEVVYPVLIDPDLTETIDADADDGHQKGSNTWESSGLYSGGINLGKYFSDYYYPGWRFQNVAVPAGATIDLVNLIPTVFGGVGTRPNGTVWGSDEDDAAAWASTTNVPTSKTKTTASTTLPSVTNGTKTIDVTTIAAEIFGRAGWASGNDVAFFIDAPTQTSNDGTYFRDYPHADTATLEIDYTEGGGGSSIPVIMHHRQQQGAS